MYPNKLSLTPTQPRQLLAVIQYNLTLILGEFQCSNTSQHESPDHNYCSCCCFIRYDLVNFNINPTCCVQVAVEKRPPGLPARTQNAQMGTQRVVCLKALLAVPTSVTAPMVRQKTTATILILLSRCAIPANLPASPRVRRECWRVQLVLQHVREVQGLRWMLTRSYAIYEYFCL